jgi:O-antigen ligase
MKNIFAKLKQFDKVDRQGIVIAGCFLLMTFFAMWIPQNWILFVVFFGLALPLIWCSPRAGFLAIILTVFIFGEYFSLLGVRFGDNLYKIYALDVALLIVFGSWFLQQPVKIMKEKWRLSKKEKWLLVFFGFLLLNLVRGLVAGGDSALAIGTFKNYSYLLVYFLFIFLFSKKDDIWRVIKWLLWSGLPLVGFIFYGWLNGAGLWSEATAGIRYLYSLHSFYLTFSLIILFTLFAYRHFVWGNIKTVLIFCVELVGMLGGMFRHLWLGLATAFLFIFAGLQFRKKNNLIKLAGISVFVLFFVMMFIFWGQRMFDTEQNILQNKYFNSIGSRITTLSQGGLNMESAADWRLETWKVAGKKIVESPIFGIGFGQKFYFEHRGFLDMIDIRNIHNDFVSILVQVGLIGFIPFLMFSFYQMRNIYYLFKIRNEETRFLTLVLGGFWIVLGFGVFFAIYLMFNGLSVFYWIVMGLISVLVKEEKKKLEKIKG